MFVDLAMQAVGVVLPVLFPSAAGYLLSALMVTGTFIGSCRFPSSRLHDVAVMREPVQQRW